jgi:hypothetical protein
MRSRAVTMGRLKLCRNLEAAVISGLLRWPPARRNACSVGSAPGLSSACTICRNSSKSTYPLRKTPFSLCIEPDTAPSESSSMAADNSPVLVNRPSARRSTGVSNRLPKPFGATRSSEILAALAAILCPGTSLDEARAVSRLDSTMVAGRPSGTRLRPKLPIADGSFESGVITTHDTPSRPWDRTEYPDAVPPLTDEFIASNGDTTG